MNFFSHSLFMEYNEREHILLSINKSRVMDVHYNRNKMPFWRFIISESFNFFIRPIFNCYIKSVKYIWIRGIFEIHN